jgi:hypothetical protein
MRRLALCLLVPIALSCAGSDDAGDLGGDGGDDLPVGELTGDDGKADGNWGSALTCKTVPALPPLAHPEIVVSLNGLTLRLADRAAGFDKVFPISPAPSTPIRLAHLRRVAVVLPPAAYGKRDFTIAGVDHAVQDLVDRSGDRRASAGVRRACRSCRGRAATASTAPSTTTARPTAARRAAATSRTVASACRAPTCRAVRPHQGRGLGAGARSASPSAPSPAPVDLTARWIGAECTADSDCAPHQRLLQAEQRSDARLLQRPLHHLVRRPRRPAHHLLRRRSPRRRRPGHVRARYSAVNSGCRPYDHFIPGP